MGVVAIMSVDSNDYIGDGKNILHHVKSDLELFKSAILPGSDVVVGRKTWDEIKNFKWVEELNLNVYVLGEGFSNTNKVKYLDHVNKVNYVLSKAKYMGHVAYILGGASVYELFKNYVDYYLVTGVVVMCGKIYKPTDVRLPETVRNHYRAGVLIAHACLPVSRIENGNNILSASVSLYSTEGCYVSDGKFKVIKQSDTVTIPNLCDLGNYLYSKVVEHGRGVRVVNELTVNGKSKSFPVAIVKTISRWW